ncbi:MAG: FAD-dependent oxidoreductase, partial [Acidimicrobiales bacterium]|nr:FAD-dependent oxidoreductase [Acidimicrobiales bacterium]
NAITVRTNAVVSEITSDAVRLADGSEIKADLVVGAIGVRPETALAVEAGLTIGPNGGVAVDGANRTSDPAIYAVGDMTEKTDSVSGDTSLIALANVANRHGRRVADAIAGRTVNEAPSLGTAIVKVFDLTAATVGWSERRLRAAGRNHRVLHSHPYSHATYYPGATQMSAKLLFDPDTGEILGAQIVGQDGVDKRIDVIATAMTGALRADRLADLELAYAPPFSSAKDPVNQLGYMAENVMGGDCDVVQAAELKTLMQDGWSVIDVRTPAEHSRGAIEGSINMALDDLRNHLDELQGTNVVVYCEVGQRGHTATALLADSGISARNLDGGYRTWVDVTRSSAT